jgi:predicted DNA-binding protein
MTPRKRTPKKSSMTKPRNVQVRLPEETYQIFVKIAEEEGRPLSNLIRYYLEKMAKEYIAKENKD